MRIRKRIQKKKKRAKNPRILIIRILKKKMIIHKKTRNQKLKAMLRKNLNQRENLMMIRMILKPVVLPKQNQKLLKKRLP